MMHFWEGGVGHKSMREATDFFRKDQHCLDTPQREENISDEQNTEEQEETEDADEDPDSDEDIEDD